MPRAVICSLIKEKTRAKGTIILWMSDRFVMDISDEDLKLQTEETDGYMFATKEQIEAFAAEGKFLHYDSIKQAFEF